MTIFYGFHDTPFGRCLLAVSGSSVCYLAFIEHEARALEELSATWPDGSLVQDQPLTGQYAVYIFVAKKAVSLELRGTTFQKRVWQELLTIQAGTTISYEAIAQRIAKPRSARAVGSAVAANHIAYVIPCHRVIKKSGELHKYRWGAALKQRMLTAEQ